MRRHGAPSTAFDVKLTKIPVEWALRVASVICISRAMRLFRPTLGEKNRDLSSGHLRPRRIEPPQYLAPVIRALSARFDKQANRAGSFT
jgi:hypothetical protein